MHLQGHNGTLHFNALWPLPPQLLDGQDSENLPDLREILEQAKRLRAKVVLIIPAQEILIRSIRFPTQTPERLKRTLSYELLGYELDRLTPFQAQDVYYEFRFLPNLSRSHVEIELAVARRVVVDVWLQRLQEANGTADVISWPGAWPNANILPMKQRHQPQRTAGIWRWLLTLLIVSLAVAVIISPLLQQRAIVADLITRVNKARHEAAKVTNLRTKIEQEEKVANFVVEQKRTANYMVSILARLTALVPDSAWVSTFNYADGQADFSGEAQQATTIIELLAKDPVFRNSSFRSPVTSMRAIGKERFDIQFNYMDTGGHN